MILVNKDVQVEKHIVTLFRYCMNMMNISGGKTTISSFCHIKEQSSSGIYKYPKNEKKYLKTLMI